MAWSLVMPRRARVGSGRLLVVAALMLAVVGRAPAARVDAVESDGRLLAGGLLRIVVPEAFGGKTVIGQLTVDRAVGAGYVTAFGCGDGLPRDGAGNVSRSDLNFDGNLWPVASNRLIVKSDNNGSVCFYTSQPASLIIDINAVTFDTGVTSFANQRTDTRGDAAAARVAAGGVLRVKVPQAVGGKTIVGQLTVDQVTDAGYVTAYGCADGLPRDAGGSVTRSDLNFDGRVTPVGSNRLMVKADKNGEICFYTVQPAAMIVDVNGVADGGIASFASRRTDTRVSRPSRIAAGGVLRVKVPEAVGGQTVIGQLTVDQATAVGFVTAYGCADGPPTDAVGTISRSDLNYNGGLSPVASNRLIVQADRNGEVCFVSPQPVAMIVDVNAVSDVGISSFANQRTDTRDPSTLPGASPPETIEVPEWAPFEPLPALTGVAALTGLPADETVTERPILAVKIDNYGQARPQWGLENADAVIEENVEGITRFIALYQSDLPVFVGPVRSARTGDLDLLAAMNRPVFAYSGANVNVTTWINSAADSGVLVDFTAQRSPCYVRSPDRLGPHNLLLDPTCASNGALAPGWGRPLWDTDGVWQPTVDASGDTSFSVAMDGVRVDWQWDPASQTYLRFQDGAPHTTVSGAQLAASTVVELFTEYIPSPADARSPNALTVGTGDAVVHRNGIVIAATWWRATASDQFHFTTADTGLPVPLDTGVAFIELTRA